ncbi:hypothetical protein DESUT3_21330 [Desulfuromonas versatilis]|uniref:Uncharacterized protein n=1 Tax=Desulfuromonas versatilis TaxID=2802975 RepID=A0ABM8HSY0_9BACT|nr:hypothetical protein [Desulfuromonas versatilis]BCR05064.1 hypothetical protein DESUT3_21330 [Desulfuromonas versatilis]
MSCLPPTAALQHYEISMKIICPDCQKENNIVVTGGTNCQHCEKPLDGYKFIKPLIPAFLLFALTLTGARTYEHYTEDNRYPTKIEYALIDQCVSSYNRPIGISTLITKRDLCINALEKTQADFSYSEFKKDQKGFMINFRQNALAGLLE